MKKILTFLALALMFTLVFSIIPFAMEEPTLTSETKVYVDFGKSDSNDGLSAATAKKTFDGAKNLLVNGGTVVATGKLYFGSHYTIGDLGGTLLITSKDGDVDYKNATPATNPSCAMKMGIGAELTIASDVVIDDIILFQETALPNYINVTNNSTLVIGENVVSMSSPYSDTPCYMAIYVEEGSTVIVKGGVFQRITGKGTIMNTGAKVIETNEANALYAINVTDGYKENFTAADAASLIENLTGYAASLNTLSESAFLSELLCGMGYTDVSDVYAKANELGLVDSESENASFADTDAYEICVAALDAKTNDGDTVAEKLVASGAVSERALGFARRIANGELITVACVGDSITEGVGSSSYSKYNYPSILQKLLGGGFKVVNCGKSGAYVMNLDSEYNVKAESRPDLWYPATEQYNILMASSPDVVIVMLGTNDARSMTAVPAEDVFETDYKKLIADIASLDSNPEIYLSTMIPAVNADMTHQGTFYTLPQSIREMATELDLPLVDTSKTLWSYFYAMLGYGDMVHPTDESYPALATNFYNEVFGHSMPLPVLEAAEEGVVYLASTGAYNNSGASPEEAVDTLAVAVAKLAENGGTIVVCDSVDVPRTHFAECGGEVVITSVYDGVDYRKSGAQLNVSGIITLLSDVKFENVNLEAVYDGQCINCGYNNLTIGKGVECLGDKVIPINAGYRIASGTILPETVSCHEDCTIRIESGKWDYVCGGNNRTNSLCPFGTVDEGATVSVIITGGEFTHVGTINVNTATGQNSVAGNVYMEISGGTFAGDISAICRAGSNNLDTAPQISGDVTLKITGGTFGGKINLYQSSESPAANGSAILVIGKPYEALADVTGFTSVSVIDVRTLLGDANDDGIFNLFDILRAVKHIVNNGESINILNTDTDDDGNVTLGDVLELLKLFADN